MPMPSAADLNRAAAIFRALAHPHRILLACCLANGRAATQSELLAQLGWPQSTMARHLGALRERGLVRGTRHGNQVLLELDGTVTPQLLATVCRWVHPDTGDHFASVLPAAAGVRP
jgi:DNA-binding transcriptional ArsR family regulator